MTPRPLATVAELGPCLVTGASGFLGRHLVAELRRRGAKVRAFDRAPAFGLPEDVEFVRADVSDLAAVREACRGIETVFHTAAAMNFAGFLRRAERRRVHAVNVEGVANVVTAAREGACMRLVHTSSNNVTFGDPVIDGDEQTPYAPRPKDVYTETKIAGERLALAANGEDLLTCAIRPGGIYGPGEKLMFPRLVEQLAAGRFVAILGDGSALSDNTFVDNLVDGEIAAARHLVPGSPVCGQAYFITDGAPINYFEFFRPYVSALGYPFPRRRVPWRPVYAVMAVWEWLHYALRVPPPPMNRLETRKIAVSHYSRIDKARRDLGYEPEVTPEEAIERCLPYVRDLHDAAKRRLEARTKRRR